MVPRRAMLRAIAAALLVGAALGFVWPVHAWVSRADPSIFGIPFSIVWVFLGQLAVFVGLLLLFSTEHDR